MGIKWDQCYLNRVGDVGKEFGFDPGIEVLTKVEGRGESGEAAHLVPRQSFWKIIAVAKHDKVAGWNTVGTLLEYFSVKQSLNIDGNY